MAFVPTHTFVDGDILPASQLNGIYTDLGNQMVDISSTQTITGNKTFSGTVTGVSSLVRSTFLNAGLVGSGTVIFYITTACTTAPTVGATYTNNGVTFTVTVQGIADGKIGYITATGIGLPAQTVSMSTPITLTKASGTGDTSLYCGAFSTSTTYTITHSKALSTPYTVVVDIFDNNGVQVLPDNVTGATNTVVVDLTSFTSNGQVALTGTWGYAYIA